MCRPIAQSALEYNLTSRKIIATMRAELIRTCRTDDKDVRVGWSKGECRKFTPLDSHPLTGTPQDNSSGVNMRGELSGGDCPGGTCPGGDCPDTSKGAAVVALDLNSISTALPPGNL